MEGRDRLVLVVEDDDDTRHVVGDILGQYGFATVGAPSGDVALDLLRGGLRPSAILLDVMMPNGNGLSFRTAQRADPRFATIPVVVASGMALTSAQLAELAPARFVRKPFGIADLASAIDAAMRSSP